MRHHFWSPNNTCSDWGACSGAGPRKAGNIRLRADDNSVLRHMSSVSSVNELYLARWPGRYIKVVIDLAKSSRVHCKMCQEFLCSRFPDKFEIPLRICLTLMF